MSDAMMFGIAKMPYELAMSDELSRRQFYANTQRLVAALEGAAGIMPRPIVTDAQRCSYRCPYYMDGPVLSLCKLDGKPLRYDGIPPLRNEKCKSTPLPPTQTGERHD